MFSGLDDLECRGHFIDLPLDENVDRANRQRVSSDQELFGAFFRPKSAELIPGVPDAVDGIDEFSPLVEAVLAPTLHLADLLGGMHRVFEEWLHWIRDANDKRRVPSRRRSYGSPYTFASFVTTRLESLQFVSPSILEAARAIQFNLSVVERHPLHSGVTMASHRSIQTPEIIAETTIGLDTPIRRGTILGTLRLNYDVVPALRGEFAAQLAEQPTFLAWQLGPDSSIRLLQIDRMVFDALEILNAGPSTGGELFLDMRRRGPKQTLDAFKLLDSLSDAAKEHVITID